MKDVGTALILGATYPMRGGGTSGPLRASENFPGRFTDGAHVWEPDGVRSGCEPGGPLDIVTAPQPDLTQEGLAALTDYDPEDWPELPVPNRSQQFIDGAHWGIRKCIAWLHARAGEMRDPDGKARDILNATATNIGMWKGWHLRNRKASAALSAAAPDLRDTAPDALARLEDAEAAQALVWCDGCRAVGAIHCAHPDQCGNMLSAAAAADQWKAWIDDLPLPSTFAPAIGRLQDFITALTTLLDVPQPGNEAEAADLRTRLAAAEGRVAALAEAGDALYEATVKAIGLRKHPAWIALRAWSNATVTPPADTPEGAI